MACGGGWDYWEPAKPVESPQSAVAGPFSQIVYHANQCTAYRPTIHRSDARKHQSAGSANQFHYWLLINTPCKAPLHKVPRTVFNEIFSTLKYSCKTRGRGKGWAGIMGMLPLYAASFPHFKRFLSAWLLKGGSRLESRGIINKLTEFIKNACRIFLSIITTLKHTRKQ